MLHTAQSFEGSLGVTLDMEPSSRDLQTTGLPRPEPKADDNSPMDEFEEYLVDFVPLSNLPTPPLGPSDSSTCAFSHPDDLSLDNGADDSQASIIFAHASHLANLVPADACVRQQRPSAHRIQDSLRRIEPDVEHIALAACILSRLTKDFARTWRASLRFSPSSPSSSPSSTASRISAITTTSSLCPEIIPLAALFIAESTLVDSAITPGLWTRGGDISARDLDMTARCVLVDLDYGVTSISKEAVDEALVDLKRAESFYAPRVARKQSTFGRAASGTAVKVDGLFTPGESPV